MEKQIFCKAINENAKKLKENSELKNNLNFPGFDLLIFKQIGNGIYEFVIKAKNDKTS